MKQTRDFPKDRGNSDRDSLRKQLKLLNTSEKMVAEVTSEVCRRDEQLYDLNTELVLHAPYSDDVAKQQNQEYAGVHQDLTGLVQETRQNRHNVSRISNCSVGSRKLIDFDEERKNSHEKYDVTIVTERNLMFYD